MTAGAALFTSLALPPALAVQPAYSFRSPFDPQQCGRAISAGRKELAQNRSAPQGRMLLAEGLLCEGLEDDPGALDAAAEMFRRIVADEPLNFFAQLELADALRKRFPLSGEAQAALRRVRELLDSADLGAARSELTDYIDGNLGAVDQQRAKALPILHGYETACAQGPLASAGVVQFVDLLALTGSAGLAEARGTLDRYLEEHPDDAVAGLHRAEVWRGSVARAQSRDLYREAEGRLCQGETDGSKRTECELAKWRLKQLEQTNERGGT